MAWIESHTTLERHAKLIQFRTAMRWNKNEAVGFLHRFWWLVLDYAPSGAFTLNEKAIDEVSPSLPLEVISEQLNMDSAIVQAALQAMERFGFLSVDDQGRYVIHDWLDYAGRYLSETKYKRNPLRLQAIGHVHGQSLDNPRTVHGTNQPTNQPTSRARAREPDMLEPAQRELYESMSDTERSQWIQRWIDAHPGQSSTATAILKDPRRSVFLDWVRKQKRTTEAA